MQFSSNKNTEGVEMSLIDMLASQVIWLAFLRLEI